MCPIYTRNSRIWGTNSRCDFVDRPKQCNCPKEEAELIAPECQSQLTTAPKSSQTVRTFWTHFMVTSVDFSPGYWDGCCSWCWDIGLISESVRHTAQRRPAFAATDGVSLQASGLPTYGYDPAPVKFKDDCTYWRVLKAKTVTAN